MLEVAKGAAGWRFNFGSFKRKEPSILSRVNKYGVVSDPRNSIEMEAPEDIIKYIIDNYELVGTEFAESELVNRKELALAKVPEYEISIEGEKLMSEISEIAQTVIKSYMNQNVTSQSASASSIPNNTERQKTTNSKEVEEIEK